MVFLFVSFADYYTTNPIGGLGLDDNSSSINKVYTLNRVNNSEFGACLDGSPPAYYFSPSPNGTDNWLITINGGYGGGWCTDPESCLQRSYSYYGSSNYYPEIVSHEDFWHGGLSSTDCDVNPEFCNFNAVNIQYCDGMSFSGARLEPLVVNNQTIYLRGFYNLEAVIKDVMKTKGMDKAVNVIFSGLSAGGLANYVHGDTVKSWLPITIKKFGIVPIAGFFLNTPNANGVNLFARQMSAMFDLGNMTASVNKKCLAKRAPGEEYLCMFALYAYDVLESHIFILNSLYDQFAITCMLAAVPVDSNPTTTASICSGAVGWDTCTNETRAFDDCTPEQFSKIVAHADKFITDLYSTRTALTGGNGAFLTSCYSHGAGYEDTHFTTIANTQLDVNMHTAVTAWWASGFKRSIYDFTWEACQLKLNAPHTCNPSCPSGDHITHY